uniref:DNA-directed RNA polymerase n=1 Tax=Staurocarteria cerasiformis TaxID=69401 RepID=A0A0S2LPX7_STACE|nr:beta subunit of RNA polymerase [Carteria cerasiformis]ALO63473.1 beta subunit of RNA polymerase [Carteria cerasiformis]
MTTNPLLPVEYSLNSYHRSNQDTCLVHRPIVSPGEWVQAGDILADCAASQGGDLSLGQNLLVAYLPWEGYNYEDAILISERLVYEDLFTSIHIEKYEIDLRETKFGLEKFTREIPDISESEKKKLDENGVIKLGTWVEEGDILVGKITPLDRKKQSPYQKLLSSIIKKPIASENKTTKNNLLFPLLPSGATVPQAPAFYSHFNKKRVVSLRQTKSNPRMNSKYPLEGFKKSENWDFKTAETNFTKSVQLKSKNSASSSRKTVKLRINKKRKSNDILPQYFDKQSSYAENYQLPQATVFGSSPPSYSLSEAELQKPLLNSTKINNILKTVSSLCRSQRGRSSVPSIVLSSSTGEKERPAPLSSAAEPLFLKKGGGLGALHSSWRLFSDSGSFFIPVRRNVFFCRNKNRRNKGAVNPKIEGPTASLVEDKGGRKDKFLSAGPKKNDPGQKNRKQSNPSYRQPEQGLVFLGGATKSGAQVQTPTSMDHLTARILPTLDRSSNEVSFSRDNSLRVPKGLRAKVVEIKIFDDSLAVEKPILNRNLWPRSEFRDSCLSFGRQRVRRTHEGLLGMGDAVGGINPPPLEKAALNQTPVQDYPQKGKLKFTYTHKPFNSELIKKGRANSGKFEFSNERIFSVVGLVPSFRRSEKKNKSSHELFLGLSLKNSTPLLASALFSTNPPPGGKEAARESLVLKKGGGLEACSQKTEWQPRKMESKPTGVAVSRLPFGLETSYPRARARQMNQSSSAGPPMQVTVKKKTDFKGPIWIYLADKRRIQIGDKIAGRHGNKGIVSQIYPRQDMPYILDGTPIDIVLNPLGVPSRMNVGQIYECLLGLAGKYLGEHFKIAPFDEIFGAEASRSLTFAKLYQARKKTGNKWLFDPRFPGKMRLFDGRTGDCFDQAITVGYPYILKLVHMVDDKIHARSTGPYSLVTQQPLRGRSKQGGQRVGEMEVWALEGYGAAFTLLEILTIKSDDMTGRMSLWSKLCLNKPISIGTPESFKVLICELQAICLDIGLFANVF